MAVATVLVLLLACSLSLGAQALSGSQRVPSNGTASDFAHLDPGQQADLFLLHKQYQQAVQLLQRTLQAGDRSAALYNRLGIAAEELDDLKLAEKAYKQAIRRDPQKAEYYNNLGTVYYGKHKWGKALKWYKKALQRKQTVASFFVNAGMAEFSRHHYQPATQYFRRALLLDPNALFPEDHGGTVVQDLEHQDPARFHFDLARLFCSLGNLEDAMHQFRMALELHYRHIDDVYHDQAFAPLRSRRDFVAIMKAPR